MPRVYLSRLARSRFAEILADFNALLPNEAGVDITDQVQAAARLLAILDIHPADKEEMAAALGFTA
jgi:hypothetical protein